MLKTELPIILWSSEDADPRAAVPLVVAHDGSEYANLASLLSLLARHGPVRAALLDPVIDRDEIYSASASYARALSTEVLPALSHQAPASIRIGMGASLGALAMLHAQRLRPSSFGALFLQSGSFFRQRWDRQESGFPRFRRIARFVGEVLSAESTAAPDPGHDDLRHRGGEPHQQPRGRRRAQAPGPPGRRCTSTATPTTTSPGATACDPHLTDLLR